MEIKRIKTREKKPDEKGRSSGGVSEACEVSLCESASACDCIVASDDDDDELLLLEALLSDRLVELVEDSERCADEKGLRGKPPSRLASVRVNGSCCRRGKVGAMKLMAIR